MQKIPIIAALLVPLALAFGQLDSNSVTVTSTHGATSSMPDQAIYSVHVNSDLNAGLDDVIAALPGSAISAANLQSLTYVNAWFNPSPPPATSKSRSTCIC
jgi:hypothetical protein